MSGPGAGGVILGGCATGPTAEQLASADYGAPITEVEAKAKAKAWVRGILKDPESARYEWDSFGQGWANQGLLYGGGYTGHRQYLYHVSRWRDRSRVGRTGLLQRRTDDPAYVPAAVTCANLTPTFGRHRHTSALAVIYHRTIRDVPGLLPGTMAY